MQRVTLRPQFYLNTPRFLLPETKEKYFSFNERHRFLIAEMRIKVKLKEVVKLFDAPGPLQVQL